MRLLHRLQRNISEANSLRGFDAPIQILPGRAESAGDLGKTLARLKLLVGWLQKGHEKLRGLEQSREVDCGDFEGSAPVCAGLLFRAGRAGSPEERRRSPWPWSGGEFPHLGRRRQAQKPGTAKGFSRQLFRSRRSLPLTRERRLADGRLRRQLICGVAGSRR